jgi:hypothetical protein
MKQMLGPQRPHQRVLHEIVSGFGVARQRAGVSSQRRYRHLDIAVKRAHAISSNRLADRDSVCPKLFATLASNNTDVCHIFRGLKTIAAVLARQFPINTPRRAFLGAA